MDNQSLKRKTIKGVAWSSVERFSVQGVQFLVMLVIARILDPKDFGLVGILTVFIAIAQSLIDSGFSQALIRKQNRTEIDNSTVFYFNIAASLVIYFFLFLLSPCVAAFYNEPQLKSLMQVLCLIVIINSFAVVQRAIYTATLNFKTQAKATLTSALVSGGVGILMAIKGCGVWSLVGQQLFNAIFNALLLWWFSSWHPRLIYSWASFRELFSFGSKLLASGLIDTVYNNLYQLVIGKVFTAASLGQYSQANHFAGMPSSNITGVLGRVTYPVLCSINDDNERLRDSYRQVLRMSAFIIFPLMCLLAGVSRPLVVSLIGEKWEEAAMLLIPLSFAMMWYPVHAINLNLLKVKGRSDLFLKLEIIKKVIGVFILVISIPFGLYVMCWAGVFASIVSLFINTYYTSKLIQVGFLMQMRDLSGSLFASLIAFICAFICQFYFHNTIIQIVVGCVVGGGAFIIIALLFKFDEMKLVQTIIRNTYKR